MAKKDQVVKAAPIRELEKTLVVNDNIYNINAVEADHSAESDHTLEADHSLEADHAVNADKAVKVNKKLTINKVGHTSTTEVSFDGSADRTVNIVPAEGGKFTGRIAVPSVSDSTLKANGETVINYNDMVTRVVNKLINTSTMATWDATAKKLIFINDSTAVNGLCVVKGLDSTLVSFSKANASSKWLPDYLFICTDSGNIYLGSETSSDVLRLAATVAKLDTICSITTNLASSKPAKFDGTNSSISPGVTGILPVANGGTGKNNLDNVTVGKANQLVSSPTVQVNLSSESAPGFNGTANIAPGVTGTLPVKHGGTGNTDLSKITVGKATNADNATNATNASNATNATNATNDSDGKQINKNYYRSSTTFGSVTNTITISSSAPSGGNNGDIWIKY